jgi:hypothetical protein
MKNAQIIALTLALAVSPAYAISWPTPSMPELNGPNALKAALILSAGGLGYVAYKKGYIGQAISTIKSTVRKYPKTTVVLATLSALLIANYYGYLDGIKGMVCNPFTKKTETTTAIAEQVTESIETTVTQTPITTTKTTTIETTTTESTTAGTPTIVATTVEATPVVNETVVIDTKATTPTPDTTTQSVTPPVKANVKPAAAQAAPTVLPITTVTTEAKPTIVQQAVDSIKSMVDAATTPENTAPAPTGDASSYFVATAE